MPRAGYDTVILDLLAMGKLDDALRELDAADASGRRPGNDVLIPLARAFLAAGRSEDSLRVLEMASVSAAFGGDLDQIATQIGMPAGNFKTPTDRVGLRPHDTDPGEPRQVEVFDTATYRRESDDVGIDTDKIIARAEAVVEEGDTDEVGLPECPTSSDTLPTRLPESPEELSPEADLGTREGRKALLEGLTTVKDGSLISAAANAARAFERRPTTRFEGPVDVGGVQDEEAERLEVTTQVDLANGGRVGESSADQGRRETMTHPLDLGQIQLTNPAVEATAAEVQRLRDAAFDMTGKIPLPEIADEVALLREGGSIPDETIQEDISAIEAKSRRPSSTNKLQLRDIEVVGSFVAGVGRSMPLIPADVGPSVEHTGAAPIEASHHPLDHPMPKAVVLPGTRTWSPTVEKTDRLRLPPQKGNMLASLLRRRSVAIVAACTFVVLIVASLASFARRRGQASEEIDHVHQLLANDTYASHRHALAVLADISDRYSDSAACAEYAVEAVQMWGRFGRGEEYRELARRTIEGCEGAQGTEPLLLAQALYSLYSGDVATGLGIAQRAVNTYPQSARLRTALAMTLEASGHTEQAIDTLSAAHMVAPAYIPAALLLARLQRQAGRRGEASLPLGQIRRLSPHHVEANTEAFMLQLDGLSPNPRPERLAMLQAMSAELETDVQGQPPSIEAYVALARGRLALVQDDVDRAGILFSKARQLGLSTPEATLHISRGLRLSGDLEGALEVSGGQHRSSPSIKLERVRVLLAVGRPDEALRELRNMEGIEHGTKQGAGESFRSLRPRLEAEALVQRGDLVEARDMLLDAITASDDAMARLDLAEVYVALGRPLESQRVLAKVSATPWSVCAEAERYDLRGEPRRALEVLNEHGASREPCWLRLRSVLAQRSGDLISEISMLRTVLRIDPIAQDRIELVKAIWRERGAHAALAEIRPTLAAPPTGSSLLLGNAEFLALAHADQWARRLFDGAARAGAKNVDLATARARFERLRGRPQEAFAALDRVPDEEASTASKLERAAALIDLGRPREARPLLSEIEEQSCSEVWVEAEKLEAMADVSLDGFAAADRNLASKVQECRDLGSTDAVQTLALWRVELGLDAKTPPTLLSSLLASVPTWPPSPTIAYLQGRIAEAEGATGPASLAYEEAIKIDQAHLPSLERLVALDGDSQHRRRLTELTTPPADDIEPAVSGRSMEP